MSKHPKGLYIRAAGAGALLAVLTSVAGMVPGSAAHLEVDGGVLQTFVFEGAP